MSKWVEPASGARRGLFRSDQPVQPPGQPSRLCSQVVEFFPLALRDEAELAYPIPPRDWPRPKRLRHAIRRDIRVAPQLLELGVDPPARLAAEQVGEGYGALAGRAVAPQQPLRPRAGRSDGEQLRPHVDQAE